MIILSLFKLYKGLLLGLFASSYEADEVLMSVGICAMVVLGLTAFVFHAKIIWVYKVEWHTVGVFTLPLNFWPFLYHTPQQYFRSCLRGLWSIGIFCLYSPSHTDDIGWKA